METMLSTIGTVVPVVGQEGSEAKPVVELEKLEHALSDKALETSRVIAIGVSITTIVKVLDILAKEEIWRWENEVGKWVEDRETGGQ